MSTALKYLLAMVAAALLSACAGPGQPHREAQDPLRDNEARAERRILVTFHDRSIGRIPMGAAGQSYRPRGGYLSSTWSHRIASRLARDYRLHPVYAWPLRTLGVHCVVYEVSNSQSIDGVLRALTHDKRVESVQKMHVFRVLTDPYAHLQTSLRAMDVERAHRWTTGRGITIAVVDTRVDGNHPDLQGQIVQTQDFISDSSTAFDNTHGTAVAGLIAALANNGKGIVGVAPGAKLISLVACGSPQAARAEEAWCDSLSLAQALDTAVRLKPQIINLSLTGPPDPLLARLIDLAIAEDMAVVAADPASSDPNFGFPASMEGVIAVRAAPTGHATQSIKINRTSIEAPGSEILTTFPHGTYKFVSGSSFAAAQVSGLAALMLELQPSLSQTQISTILHSAHGRVAATDASESSGIVNACILIDKLRNSSSCSAHDVNTVGGAHPASDPYAVPSTMRLSAISPLSPYKP